MNGTVDTVWIESQAVKFGEHKVWLHGIESRFQIKEEKPELSLRILQMFYSMMQHSQDSIISALFVLIGIKMVLNLFFKLPHHTASHCRLRDTLFYYLIL